MLKPIPNSLTQCIRSFSKNLEGWLNAALNDVVPEELKAIKVIFALLSPQKFSAIKICVIELIQ